jgi:hypothetical protein
MVTYFESLYKSKQNLVIILNLILFDSNWGPSTGTHLTLCPQSRTSPSPLKAKLRIAINREGECVQNFISSAEFPNRRAGKGYCGERKK